MAVDILLSTYNGAAFVDAQIDSLFRQTHQDFTLCIRDDGSKDATPEKLLRWKKKYPDRIALLLESNVGVIESFNRAFSLSRAPYIAFCDQDDIWLPRKLEASLQLICAHAAPTLIHSDLTVVDKDLRQIAPSFWAYAYLSGAPKYATLSRLLVQNVVTGCTTLVNRELANLAFPVPPEALMHDWWFALTAAAFGNLLSIQDQFLLYRQHGNNTLGAQAYSLLKDPRTNLQKLLKAAKHEKRKLEQAAIFLSRYGALLQPPQRELLTQFISLNRSPRLSRMAKIIKYKFYKIGLGRNLFHLLKSR